MEHEVIIQRTIALLTDYLSYCSKETQKWIFIVHHSIRVEGLVRDILEGEPPLPDKTNLTLRVAAVSHDTSSFKDGSIYKPNHAKLGAHVVDDLLKTTGSFLAPHVAAAALISLIRYHSRRIDVPVEPELAILRDADILDQVGAMTILQQANRGEYSHAKFYFDLYTRLTAETLQECEAIASRLFTSTARRILEHKRAFISSFIDQLDKELGETRNFQM